MCYGDLCIQTVTFGETFVVHYECKPKRRKMGNGCSNERSTSLVQLNRENIPNYKIVLIGDPSVGKSNILLRYGHHQFDYSYRPTDKVNIKNVVRKLNVPANAVVSLTLWDVPGHEDMDLRKTYYRNVDAVLVIVDLSDTDTLELCGTWRQDFLSKASRTQDTIETQPSGIQTVKTEEVKGFDPRKVPMVLLGNKYDLIEDNLEEERLKAMLKETSHNVSSQELQLDGAEDLDALAEELQRDIDAPLNTGNKKASKDICNQEEKKKIVSGHEAEGDDKPECIKMLEAKELEHGFTASIVVSAKKKDGSVDTALQALVRHLMGKSDLHQYKAIKVKADKKIKKKKHAKVDPDNLLTPVGHPEIDGLFSRCNIPVQRALDYQSYYQLSLKHFKETCLEQGYVQGTQPSLEDCIVGLRDFIEKQLDRSLLVEDEAGFLILYFNVYKTDEDKKLMKQHQPLNSLMQDFAKEYAAVCKAIIRDCPTMDGILVKLDNRIKSHVENLKQQASSQAEHQGEGQNESQDENWSQKDMERMIVQCERNQARMAHSRLVIKEVLETVQTACKKIKAALLW